LIVAAVAWSQPEPPPGGANNPGAVVQQRGGETRIMPGGMMPEAGPPHGDAMMENFFPPELVMRHQKEIVLTADQQKAIRAEMLDAAPKFMDLQWRQSDEEEAMQALLKEAHPDEKAVLAQLDKVLAIENDLKRLQLGNLVRIKNILTPEQQAKLTELRNMNVRPRRMPGGMMPGQMPGQGGMPGGQGQRGSGPGGQGGAGQPPPGGGEE
jgi:Spy/CpxP family protein refolding chaperone